MCVAYFQTVPAWWKSVCSVGQSLNAGCLSSCAVVGRAQKTPLMISVSVFPWAVPNFAFLLALPPNFTHITLCCCLAQQELDGQRRKYGFLVPLLVIRNVKSDFYLIGGMLIWTFERCACMCNVYMWVLLKASICREQLYGVGCLFNLCMGSGDHIQVTRLKGQVPCVFTTEPVSPAQARLQRLCNMKNVYVLKEYWLSVLKMKF